MSTDDHVRVLHAEPSGQHASIAATESDNRAVSVGGVGALDGFDELDVVHECLVHSQEVDVAWLEGGCAERKRFTIEAMLSKKDYCSECLGQGLGHEA